LFVTFCKLTRELFPGRARDLVLEHCLYENGKRVDLHAVVIMPDHVHLLFTPLRAEDGWPYPLPKILKDDQGNFGPRHKQIAWQLRASLAGRVLRSRSSIARKLERKN
jgi:REP element-mobilizing transposase RayT